MSYTDSAIIVAPPSAYFPKEERKINHRILFKMNVLNKIYYPIVDQFESQQHYSANVAQGITESRDSAFRSALYSKVNSFRTYNEGWDGENANAIEELCINNAKQLIDKLPASLIANLCVDDIYPTPNGTITIEFGTGRRYFIIDVGNSMVLFYYRFDNLIEGIDEAISFSEYSMHQINDLFAEFVEKTK